MIAVERATPAHFGEVLPLLRQFNNPSLGDDRWRSLFHYTWPSEDDTRGFLLRAEGRCVGFFGAIHFERDIAGRREKFANLTSWVVEPAFRNHSLRLLEAVTNIEGRTLHCFTPTPATHPLYARFGFSDLETKWITLLPRLTRGFPGALLRHRFITNPGCIASLLPDAMRAIYEHQRPHAARHLLVRARGNRQCLVTFTRTRGARYPLAHVHSVSDPELFTAASAAVRWRLMLAAHAAAVVVDARLLAGRAQPASREAAITRKAVFRSGTLRADQIDGLYSELVLLGSV